MVSTEVPMQPYSCWVNSGSCAVLWGQTGARCLGLGHQEVQTFVWTMLWQ